MLKILPRPPQEFCGIRLQMPREDQNLGDSSPAAVQCPQGKRSFQRHQDWHTELGTGLTSVGCPTESICAASQEVVDTGFVLDWAF